MPQADGEQLEPVHGTDGDRTAVLTWDEAVERGADRPTFSGSTARASTRPI